MQAKQNRLQNNLMNAATIIKLLQKLPQVTATTNYKPQTKKW